MKKILELSLTALICLFLVTACGDSSAHEFEPLYNRYQEILSYSGPDYDEPIKKIETLQDQIRAYLKRFPQSNKRTEAERILAETKDIQLKLQQEQFDFSELEKQFKLNPTPYETDTQINEIKNFIRKYPNSLNRSLLTDKIDELNFKKFQQETSFVLNTIPDVNRMVQISMNYLGQIRDKKLKDQVRDKINNTEAQRNTIFQNEFHLRANELLQQMRLRVVEIAQNSHPFSNIEKIKETFISGDISTPVNHVIVICEYNVHMKGAIIGLNRYNVTIQAKGIINGTSQSGVTSSVADAAKVADFKVN